MLNKVSNTLDHILSLGQPPNLNWGLGYHGTNTQCADTSERVNFVPGTSSSEPVAQKQHVAQTTSEKTALGTGRTVKRKNGCHFCCRSGHRVSSCHFRKNQYQRAWRLNLCYMEPSRFGQVWIAKKDLYPNFRNRVSPRREPVVVTT